MKRVIYLTVIIVLIGFVFINTYQKESNVSAVISVNESKYEITKTTSPTEINTITAIINNIQWKKTINSQTTESTFRMGIYLDNNYRTDYTLVVTADNRIVINNMNRMSLSKPFRAILDENDSKKILQIIDK